MMTFNYYLSNWGVQVDQMGTSKNSFNQKEEKGELEEVFHEWSKGVGFPFTSTYSFVKLLSYRNTIPGWEENFHHRPLHGTHQPMTLTP